MYQLFVKTVTSEPQCPNIYPVDSHLSQVDDGSTAFSSWLIYTIFNMLSFSAIMWHAPTQNDKADRDKYIVLNNNRWEDMRRRCVYMLVWHELSTVIEMTRKWQNLCCLLCLCGYTVWLQGHMSWKKEMVVMFWLLIHICWKTLKCTTPSDSIEN